MSHNKDVAISAVKLKFEEVLYTAGKLYPSLKPQIDQIALSTKLTGTSAGKARMKVKNDNRYYVVEINVEMMTISDRNYNGILNNTISHEIAHVIDFIVRGTSKHDTRWKAIHRNLGGNGASKHDYDVLMRGGNFVYNVLGNRVVISKTRHKRLMGLESVYNCRIAGEDVRITPAMFVGQE